MKDGYCPSEVRAHEYFKSLGFKIFIPGKKQRLGYDFEIQLYFEGELFTAKVEVKSRFGDDILKPQVNVIKQGGLLFVNNKVPEIFVAEDLNFELNLKVTRRFTARRK